MALKNLGVAIDHLFACDVNRHAKTTIMENFPPRVFYDDLTVRDNATARKADIYIAGFPCQPFSTAGLQQGFNDKKGRGTIFFHVRDYIEHAQPKIFVLENVSGLMKLDGGRYYQEIMESLNELGTYNVQAKILDTKEHGVPQSRRRVYFVGIKKSCDRGTFEYPEPVPKPSIERFLQRRRGKVDKTMLPPVSQGTARANVKRALKELEANGLDPLNKPWIIDCDSSGPRMKYTLEVSPCLTCSRAGGHWITNRGRRMTKTEMMRLQAMHTPADGFKVAVSEPQLGKQIGNAMSVNVLERLFARLLPAAGLAAPGSLCDRWADSSSAPAVAGAKRKTPAAAAASAAAAPASKRARRAA